MPCSVLSALSEACCEAAKCEFFALRPPGTLEPYRVEALGIEQMVLGAGKGYSGVWGHTGICRIEGFRQSGGVYWGALFL